MKPKPRLTQFLLRFFTAYFLVYLSNPLPVWRAAVGWVAGLLGVSVSVGSGPIASSSTDTTYHYILILLFLAIALAVASAWTGVARGRTGRHTHDVVSVLVRYVLAFFLLAYGLDKIFLVQFPILESDRLAMRFGDMSRMGVLWSFMAVSPGYTVFTGVVEAASGLLLYWRRTVLPGALLAVSALTNVVALNFGYDVCVKTFSVHLLVFSAFLVVPSVPVLLRFLFRSEPATLTPPRPSFELSGRALLAARVIKAAVVILSVGSLTFGFASARQANLDADHPLRGYYEVVDGEDEDARPLGWTEVGIDSKGRLTAWKTGHDPDYFNTDVDDDNRMVLRPRPNAYEAGDPSAEPVGSLVFERVGGALELKGALQSEAVSIRLHRVKSAWRPTHRPSWVHEQVPYR